MIVYWFKRDLRLQDNHALSLALRHAQHANAPLLLVYIFEPALINDDHYSERHWRFVYESLKDIQLRLHTYNVRLYVDYRSAEQVFTRLNNQSLIQAIYSHQETGLLKTYQRDLCLKTLFAHMKIDWYESPMIGIQRGLSNRLNWLAHWKKEISAPLISINLFELAESMHTVSHGIYNDTRTIPLEFKQPNEHFQYGGESEAHELLDSFLHERITHYMQSISKPHASRTGCSRLSPYLAWGNVSIRQVYQRQLKARREHKNTFNFTSFAARLRWQSHFIQKFESEHSMEWKNLNNGFDHLDRQFNQEHFTAWCTGNTGYPLIDACMRCLHATGYINFRMRAMLVSFATELLWLPWQPVAKHLAQLFLDFEPGIHYPQIQMQSGVTGINAIRIYNPVKQSYDNDTKGEFILKWCPELINLPIEMLHEPWNLTPMDELLYAFSLGNDYPEPIIDREVAARHARDKLYGIKKTYKVHKENQRILKRHTFANQ